MYLRLLNTINVAAAAALAASSQQTGDPKIMAFGLSLATLAALALACSGAIVAISVRESRLGCWIGGIGATLALVMGLFCWQNAQSQREAGKVIAEVVVALLDGRLTFDQLQMIVAATMTFAFGLSLVAMPKPSIAKVRSQALEVDHMHAHSTQNRVRRTWCSDHSLQCVPELSFEEWFRTVFEREPDASDSPANATIVNPRPSGILMPTLRLSSAPPALIELPRHEERRRSVVVWPGANGQLRHR